MTKTESIARYFRRHRRRWIGAMVLMPVGGVVLWQWLSRVTVTIRWPKQRERDWCEEGRGPVRW